MTDVRGSSPLIAGATRSERLGGIGAPTKALGQASLGQSNMAAAHVQSGSRDY